VKRALERIVTNVDGIGFRPPAEPSSLDAYERELGVALPDDLRALWLLHDGQDGEGLWLPAPFLSVAQSRALRDEHCGFVVHEWLERTLDADPRQRDCVYHPRRVPLAASDLGDHYVHVDLAPGPAGTCGQVIELVSECDFEVLAPSLGALLERYAR
jgi:cell wall assembly regulator SMI1